METRDDILRLLTDRRESLRGFGVKELGIFGSFARDEQNKNSDVDVLVELEKNTFDSYMSLLFYLEELFGRKVDLATKDSIKPMIRNRVLREAVYVADL
jgi:predicted nucleotidyltransferase